MDLKLGKLPKRTDKRTLQFAQYLKANLSTPPPVIDYSDQITQWGMMLNDTLGDCTIAAASHAIEEWSQGKTIIADEIIKAFYFSITGGQDSGCVELDVLNAWHNKGLGGDNLGAYAEVNITSQYQLKQAIYMFNGLYIGVNLPQSAMDQFNSDQPWTVSGDNTILGGHALLIVGYDSQYVSIITWGQLIKADWNWLMTYMDEAYVLISKDYFSGDKTAEGFDLVTLDQDAIAISDGTYNIDPPTPPAPPQPKRLTWWQRFCKWLFK
jgi:hypothetical protein